MIKLPQVTLCCLGSAKYKDAQQRALEYSCRGIEFGAVKNIIQECRTIDEWNRAIIYDLNNHIDTEFCLLVHPDGYVVHPDLWQDAWLDWDFIGAPWPLPTDSFSYRFLFVVKGLLS